jgi:hypothetical protein
LFFIFLFCIETKLYWGGMWVGIVNTSLVLFCASPPALWSLPLSSYVGSSPPYGPAVESSSLSPALRTYDMMWWLALDSKWESLCGGTTLVVRNLYRKLVGIMKKWPQNAELEDREPGG